MSQEQTIALSGKPIASFSRSQFVCEPGLALVSIPAIHIGSNVSPNRDAHARQLLIVSPRPSWPASSTGAALWSSSNQPPVGNIGNCTGGAYGRVGFLEPEESHIETDQCADKPLSEPTRCLICSGLTGYPRKQLINRRTDLSIHTRPLGRDVFMISAIHRRVCAESVRCRATSPRSG